MPANIGERVIRRLETLVEMHGDKKLIDELEFQKGWCSPDGIAQFDVAGIQHRIDTLRERSKLSTTKHNTSKE